MGTDITGPMSKQKLKLPFTNYFPLEEGPIGNPNKIYRIGYTIHGFTHPWLLNNADSAMWEANRHSNVRLTILDPEFDNQKQVQQIDAWVADDFDGIMIWPMQEAPTGPPGTEGDRRRHSLCVHRPNGGDKQNQCPGNG